MAAGGEGETHKERKLENQGKRLEGKVAIVTGGASGIGEAVAKIYAANACKVLIVDLNEERLRQVEADIKGGHGVCAARCADVTDEAQVIGFFRDTVERWGKLDILVNSAGRDSLAPPIAQVTLEEWNKTIGPNLTGVFLCCREAFRIMEKQESGGRIINMGSSSARLASGPGHCPYRASKHGMMGLSKNILLEGMKKRIGVTVINPSHVKTPMTEIIDKGLYDGTSARLPGRLAGREGKQRGDLRQLHRRGERRRNRPVRRDSRSGGHHPADRHLSHAQGTSLRHGSLMKAAYYYGVGHRLRLPYRSSSTS